MSGLPSIVLPHALDETSPKIHSLLRPCIRCRLSCPNLHADVRCRDRKSVGPRLFIATVRRGLRFGRAPRMQDLPRRLTRVHHGEGSRAERSALCRESIPAFGFFEREPTRSAQFGESSVERLVAAFRDDHHIGGVEVA